MIKILDYCCSEFKLKFEFVGGQWARLKKLSVEKWSTAWMSIVNKLSIFDFWIHAFVFIFWSLITVDIFILEKIIHILKFADTPFKC